MTDNSNDQKKRYTLYDPQEVFDFHISKAEKDMYEFHSFPTDAKADMAMWRIMKLELDSHFERLRTIVIGCAFEEVCNILKAYLDKEAPTKEDRENLARDLARQSLRVGCAMFDATHYVPPADFQNPRKFFFKVFNAWKAKNDAAKDDAAKNDAAKDWEAQ